MNTSLLRSIALAAALSLVAGAATAQTRFAPADPPPSANLGYSAAPLGGHGYAYRDRGGLTVMGMTGAVEPKYPDTTGSITPTPRGAWAVRAR